LNQVYTVEMMLLGIIINLEGGCGNLIIHINLLLTKYQLQIRSNGINWFNFFVNLQGSQTYR